MTTAPPTRLHDRLAATSRGTAPSWTMSPMASHPSWPRTRGAAPWLALGAAALGGAGVSGARFGGGTSAAAAGALAVTGGLSNRPWLIEQESPVPPRAEWRGSYSHPWVVADRAVQRRRARAEYPRADEGRLPNATAGRNIGWDRRILIGGMGRVRTDAGRPG